jgi:hypothetical protein
MAARMRLAVSTGQFAKHTGDIPTYFNDCAAAYGLALVQPSTHIAGRSTFNSTTFPLRSGNPRQSTSLMNLPI